MTAEHETMTAEQIEALKIWAPYWSDADCRNAIAAIASLQAALAVARPVLCNLLDYYETESSGEDQEPVWRARSAIDVIDAALKGAHPAQGGENVG